LFERAKGFPEKREIGEIQRRVWIFGRIFKGFKGGFWDFVAIYESYFGVGENGKWD
jgi:hypothetical protein